jgi:phage terminase small subunit
MPDSLPKPAGQRRRRNMQPSSAKLPASGLADSALVPAPPEGLGEYAVDAWRVWWSSPMAVVWIESDLPALTRMCRLTDQAARGDASAAVLSEVRQLEDRFGLSPLARRRLQWEIEKAGGAGADAPVEQEGRWLRVVSD